MDLTNLTFIDVETTGLSPVRDRIIEIGILRLQNGRITKEFSSLVNPDMSLPPEITIITGITAAQLEHAPPFSAIVDEVSTLLSDSVFVAHNARFDYAFIKSEFTRLERSFTSQTLCTAKLSRRLYPDLRRHNLDSIIERHRIPCDLRHRAFSDAVVLSEFWNIVRKNFSKKILTDAIAHVMKSASLPATIPRAMIQELPESAGVYIFYGKDRKPLYIGKSVNIRDRVLSHFYEYSRSAKEARIFRTIESVEAIKTSGELGALLLESRMIKQYQPPYNRMLRKSNTLTALFRETLPDGYFGIRETTLEHISLGEIDRIIAVFHTRSQLENTLLEISRTHKLCQKLLGIEKTRGRCFGSQIETCNGACIGRELPARYNMRFTEAFYRTRVKQWPFPGPIAIREGDTAHLVYKWCYLGDASDSTDPDQLTSGAVFDYDSYRILSSHLLKKSRDADIRVLQTSRVA